MEGFRKVPKKVQIVGDIRFGKLLIGRADSELKILEQQMRDSKPKPLDQGFRVVRPFPDTVIECWSCFTLQGVKITTGIGRPRPKKQQKEFRCQCYPCLAFGVILKVIPIGLRYSYDITLCLGKRGIIIFTDFPGIQSCGFEKYNKGQFVFVASKCGAVCLGEDMQDCLTNTIKADDGVTPELFQLLVLPINNPEDMKVQEFLL